MRAMLIAFMTLAVAAVAADILLDGIGFSTAERTAGAAVRVD